MKFQHAFITSLISSGLVHGKNSDPCTGDIKFESKSELSSSPIHICKKFTGSISVTGSYEGDASFPYLETMDGTLSFDAEKVTGVSLDALTRVSKVLSFNKIEKIGTIQISKLNSAGQLYIHEVGGDFDITFQPGLKFVSRISIQDTRLNKLQNIHTAVIDDIDIRGNPELEKLELTDLTRAQSNIMFIGNKKANFEAPKLEVVQGEFQLIDLSSFDLPALETVSRKLQFTKLKVKKISVPKLSNVVGGLVINNNKALQELDLSDLKSLGTSDLKIHDNPALATIDLGKLVSVGGLEILAASSTNITVNSQLTGRGTLKIKTQADCKKFNELEGKSFSHVSCVTVPKPTQPTQPEDNNSSGIQMSFSAIALLFGLLVTIL